MIDKLPNWTIDRFADNDDLVFDPNFACYLCKQITMKRYTNKNNIEMIKCSKCSFQMVFSEFVDYTMKWCTMIEKGEDTNNKIAGNDSLL